ncbi:MAG: hypothetical protein KDD64_16060 [Bdellovibrionales bacterium]|nr:hypothetical protein [Bdellovibrionales bacterium]
MRSTIRTFGQAVVRGALLSVMIGTVSGCLSDGTVDQSQLYVNGVYSIDEDFEYLRECLLLDPDSCDYRFEFDESQSGKTVKGAAFKDFMASLSSDQQTCAETTLQEIKNLNEKSALSDDTFRELLIEGASLCHIF